MPFYNQNIIITVIYFVHFRLSKLFVLCEGSVRGLCGMAFFLFPEQYCCDNYWCNSGSCNKQQEQVIHLLYSMS